MDHPTCAPERHPTDPPAGEPDLATLSKQATADVNALREAHVAFACMNKLLLHAPSLRGDEGHIGHLELKALAALVNAEGARRLRAANSTVASMQQRLSPRRTNLPASP
jgi:hypothetical protein